MAPESCGYNIAQCLKRSAARFPDQPAICEGIATVYDYREFAELAAKIAFRLIWRHKAGSRIAIVAENSPRYLPALFGIWWAGMIAVPINVRLHEKEVWHILNDCGCSEALNLDEDFASERGNMPLAPVAPDAPAWIFYTSGTTGKPKGATLTHANLHAMCGAFQLSVESILPRDAMLHCCQLSHGSGLYALPHVMAGAKNVVLPGKFDPHEARELLDYHQAVTFGPPTVLNRIVRLGPMNKVARLLIFGGSPFYEADARRALYNTGGAIAQIYGQGESPCTITSITAAMYEANRDRCVQTVGMPQYGCRVAVVTDDREPARRGEPGEVLVKGPTVMAGYWGNEKATREALWDGWLHTGDIGALDADGHLRLLGRKKECIISGGFNVYPREVEEVLLKSPEVAEVAVVGAASDKWGEQVEAYVVHRFNADIPLALDCLRDTLDFLCRENIASFKRPRAYHFVAELPRGLTDKVQKSELAHG